MTARLTRDTQIPASWVAAGHGIPDVCSRHGEPAERRRRVQLVSSPPGWSYALLIAGALPFLIVAVALRKTVAAPAWPFCARCRSVRRATLGSGLGLVILSPLVFFAQVSADDGAVGLILPVSLLLFVVGIILTARSSAAAIARARVSSDGTWVRVVRADERFADRVQAALAAAAPQAGTPAPRTP